MTTKLNTINVSGIIISFKSTNTIIINVDNTINLIILFTSKVFNEIIAFNIEKISTYNLVYSL